MKGNTLSARLSAYWLDHTLTSAIDVLGNGEFLIKCGAFPIRRDGFAILPSEFRHGWNAKLVMWTVGPFAPVSEQLTSFRSHNVPGPWTHIVIQDRDDLFARMDQMGLPSAAVQETATGQRRYVLLDEPTMLVLKMLL
jgi:hypothetical protein